jgi:outer membrane protein, heavy metal efflux system
MRHSFTWFAVVGLAVFAGPTSRAQAPGEPAVRLGALVEEALRKNPEIEAARREAVAARARVRGAAAWDPPRAGVEFYQTPLASFPDPVRDGMETDYYLEQMIPFPGKTGATGKTTRFGARMADEGVRTAERRVVFELKSAVAELYFIRRKIELNGESRRFMRPFADVASRQYEVGIGSRTDALRAGTELAKLDAETFGLERESRSAEATINMLLNRPLDGTLGRIDTLDAALPRWPLRKLDSLALASRPELLAMRLETEMNRAEIRSARLGYAPDIMTRLMLKDMAMTSKDYWSFMVGVTLPFAPWSFSKAAAGVGEMEARAGGSEASLAGMTNEVLLDVRNAWLALEADGRLVDLNRGTLLPQAESALESAAAGYRTGQVMFVMLIDSWRMALMARQDYCMAVMNRAVSLARLERAVGLDVSEIAERIR